MKIFDSLEEYGMADAEASGRRLAVTLGKFDGIHLGHQKLISRVVEKASSDGLVPAVFAIGINENGILTEDERAGIIAGMGVDILVRCPFSKEFMTMSPETFAVRILRDCLHASYVAVGSDYRFGHMRAGDASMLKTLGSEYGFETDILEKEMYLGEEISSTRTRTALSKGDMDLVYHLLGRRYGISGTVNHGRHIGTGIGMPTVNLMPPEGKLLPPDGVYATKTYTGETCPVDGVTNIGFRPTVHGTHRTIETTLFDFDEDLYGQDIKTEFYGRIRSEIRFDSLAELKEQVERDAERARDMLGSGHDEP